MNSILSFYTNFLLKLSLSQSILITTLTSWIQCLWGGILVSTFPQAFLEVLHHSMQHVGRNCCHFFPDVLFQIHHCPCVSFLTPCSWDILRGRSIATRDTRFNEYWSADEISTESRQSCCFWNTSPQQKPDALQTSGPRQLKCFKSR